MVSPGHLCCEPITWEPRGGTPLLVCINDRVHAVPYLGQRTVGTVGKSVERVDGLELDFRMFPASEPSARVLVKTSGSPTGYGSRRLSGRELGNLWDVPNLFLDSLQDAEVTDLMGAICFTPSSWLLHTGADVLLTTGFRGGWSARGQAGQDITPGPRPWTDTDLGLLPEVQRQRRDAELASHVAAVEIRKGDMQKVDNAAVPDQLWLRAFVLGYGDAPCPAQHLEALNLTIDGSAKLLKDPPGKKDPQAGWLYHKEPPTGWVGALTGFRVFGLRYWQHQVTRGNLRWRRTIVLLPPMNEAAVMECHMEWQNRVEQPAYSWSRAGRRTYQAEWRAMRATTDGKATVEAGLDAVYRCADATWFEWPKGSAPLFWNWSPEYQREVRDGQPHFMTGRLEAPFLRKQSKARDPNQHELMRAKVVQVHQWGYIKTGEVVSGTHYSCVPKGTSDIRMVYNGTSCGLNACLYAPCYGLLQVKHTLRALREGYYQCDLDVGEQFLNFKLHDDLRQLSWVDVHEVRSWDPADGPWESGRTGS